MRDIIFLVFVLLLASSWAQQAPIVAPIGTPVSAQGNQTFLMSAPSSPLGRIAISVTGVDINATLNSLNVGRCGGGITWSGTLENSTALSFRAALCLWSSGADYLASVKAPDSSAYTFTWSVTTETATVLSGSAPFSNTYGILDGEEQYYQINSIPTTGRVRIIVQWLEDGLPGNVIVSSFMNRIMPYTSSGYVPSFSDLCPVSAAVYLSPSTPLGMWEFSEQQGCSATSLWLTISRTGGGPAWANVTKAYTLSLLHETSTVPEALVLDAVTNISLPAPGTVDAMIDLAQNSDRTSVQIQATDETIYNASQSYIYYAIHSTQSRFLTAPCSTNAKNPPGPMGTIFSNTLGPCKLYQGKVYYSIGIVNNITDAQDFVTVPKVSVTVSTVVDTVVDLTPGVAFNQPIDASAAGFYFYRVAMPTPSLGKRFDLLLTGLDPADVPRVYWSYGFTSRGDCTELSQQATGSPSLLFTAPRCVFPVATASVANFIYASILLPGRAFSVRMSVTDAVQLTPSGVSARPIQYPEQQLFRLPAINPNELNVMTAARNSGDAMDLALVAADQSGCSPVRYATSLSTTPTVTTPFCANPNVHYARVSFPTPGAVLPGSVMPNGTYSLSFSTIPLVDIGDNATDNVQGSNEIWYRFTASSWQAFTMTLIGRNAITARLYESTTCSLVGQVACSAQQADCSITANTALHRASNVYFLALKGPSFVNFITRYGLSSCSNLTSLLSFCAGVFPPGTLLSLPAIPVAQADQDARGVYNSLLLERPWTCDAELRAFACKYSFRPCKPAAYLDPFCTDACLAESSCVSPSCRQTLCSRLPCLTTPAQPSPPPPTGITPITPSSIGTPTPTPSLVVASEAPPGLLAPLLLAAAVSLLL